MKTHEFIEEMQELGYIVSENYYYIDVTFFREGKMELVAQISNTLPNKLNTLFDKSDLITEDASKLIYTYSQTPIEDRKANYYYLKTDYDTGRDDYVYNTPDYQSHFHQILMLTTNRETAKVFDRETAIKIAKEYPYLELEKIQSEKVNTR